MGGKHIATSFCSALSRVEQSSILIHQIRRVLAVSHSFGRIIST